MSPQRYVNMYTRSGVLAYQSDFTPSNRGCCWSQQSGVTQCVTDPPDSTSCCVLNFIVAAAGRARRYWSCSTLSQFDDVTHKGSHLGKPETIRWEESFFCYELSTNEGRNHVTCNVAALSFCVKAEPCSTPLIPVLSLSAPCSRASRVGLVMYLHVIAAAITCSLSSTIAVWSRSSCSDWCCETLLLGVK